MEKKQKMNMILDLNLIQQSSNTTITDPIALAINPKAKIYTNVITFTKCNGF